MRAASSIDAISESVVAPNGSSRITSVCGLSGLDARAHQHVAPPVVVGPRVHQAALGKVGQDLERLLLQDRDLRFEQLGEIVRQDAGGDADGDALGAEHEQQGESWPAA